MAKKQNAAPAVRKQAKTMTKRVVRLDNPATRDERKIRFGTGSISPTLLK